MGGRSPGWLIAGVALLAGCAGQAMLPAAGDGPPDHLAACERWFAALDQATDRAGVRDGQAHRLPGFPYLRVDRFLASFADQALQGDAAFEAWFARLRAQDTGARQHEIGNLPSLHWAGPGITDGAQAQARTADCASRLAARDHASRLARARIVGRARVPDDYSDVGRALGLYPLTGLLFEWGIAAWQRETVAAFRHTGEAGRDGNVLRVGPPGGELPAARLRDIFSRAERDALGIPSFAAADLDTLLAAYAPVFEIAGTAAHDRIGAVRWAEDGLPAVDIARPVVYRRLAFTRLGGRSLPQFVYTAWFPERPAAGMFDVLAGRLDGVVFRVTVDEAGTPLLYDSIHPCGCYHMFFPTPRIAARAAPAQEVEWMFSPSGMPAVRPGQRVAVVIASRTHALVRVALSASAAEHSYAWLDDDELRSLPEPRGGRRSLFGPDGLVRGTERAERLFFWPMGIASAGAMRQWGRHPTAFVGRRHFDDPDLIERRFERVEPTPLPQAQ